MQKLDSRCVWVFLHVDYLKCSALTSDLDDLDIILAGKREVSS